MESATLLKPLRQRENSANHVVQPSLRSFMGKSLKVVTAKKNVIYFVTLTSNVVVAISAWHGLRRVKAGWTTWVLCVVGPTLLPRLNRLSYDVMRWPLLAVVYGIIAVEFFFYVILRLFVRCAEAAVATPAHRSLRQQLSSAPDFDTWLACARALDKSKQVELWQANLRSTRYNWNFVKDLIEQLREGRTSGNWKMVAVALRLCSRPNVGGIMAPQLFSQTHTGDPKVVVTEFVDEMNAAIAWLTSRALESGEDSDSARSCRRVTSELFQAARESYGRTVLSMSGGGALGAYHFGVTRALFLAEVLPDTICGTSAGAIVAAFLCSRTDAELERDLLDDDALRSHLVCFDQTPLQCLARLWRSGTLYDGRRWLEVARWFANDGPGGVANMTFAEAFQRSRRRLAITVCARGKRAPPVLLTHLTSPHVVVASAIVATAGVPGLIAPTVLLEKDPETGVVAPQKGGEAYMDGSLVHDIPTIGLKEAFNARFVVASQVNPHIAPLLFYGTHGAAGEPCRWSSPRRSEDSWRGGFVLAALELYLRTDMLSKLQFLRDVDASPGWTGSLFTQSFEGSVTITPALRLADYFSIFTNPNEESMQHFLLQGRVAAYQKIAMVRTRYSVERALADGCARLAAAEYHAESPRCATQKADDCPPVAAMPRINHAQGALHWATPETIKDFSCELDDCDDASSTYFTDDGL